MIDHYEADVQTAQDYYPFGMIMPGRMFTALTVPGASVSGTTNVNGFTVPVDLALTSRSGNEPTQYVASRTIDLDEGFESGTNDDVTAYLTDTSYAGSGNGGSGADGVAGAGKYRYGFNGKEQDNEVKGMGNQLDYGVRIFDPRLGRFLSTDPITKEYPDLSPYQFASNTPIGAIDIDGLESNKKFNLKEWLIDFGKGILKGGAGIDLDNPFSGPLLDVGMFQDWKKFQKGSSPVKRAAQQVKKEGVAKVLTKRVSQGISDVKKSVVHKAQQVANGEPKAIGEVVGFGAGLAVPMAGEIGSTLRAEQVEAGMADVGEGIVSQESSTVGSEAGHSVTAKEQAYSHASNVMNSTPKAKLPRAVTTIVDTKTGQSYYGQSGVLQESNINPQLKSMLPEQSLEDWKTHNCAECDALNNALNAGAKVEDLEMHTLKLNSKTKTT